MTKLNNSAMFTLIVLGTIVGMAGTDLVLPAIPSLPNVLGGDLRIAQWVLGAYAAGTGIGLLVYGELGTRFNVRTLLAASLVVHALVAFSATFADNLPELSAIRFMQGFVVAAPAVFAPMMIKSMYGSKDSVAMLGRLGSIESITPALAPILGAWLLAAFDWRFSFYLSASVSLCLGCFWFAAGGTHTQYGQSKRSRDGYLPLLLNSHFLRNSLSQALTLGALLIVVFAAPTIVTHALGGDISDFIIMQVLGIALYVFMANTSHILIGKYGDRRTILAGTTISAFGCLGIFCLSLFWKPPIWTLWFFFCFVNLGMGIRGPAGFFRALQASGENDSRGSALTILFIMMTVALGTVAVSPFIEDGLVGVGAIVSALALIAIWLSWSSEES
jgi:MFS family permease